MLQKPWKTGPPNTREIKDFLHCKRCEESCPVGMNFQEWSDLEVGFTPYGFQVWCHRHNCNVVHLDFRGSRIPINASAERGIIWPGSH